MRIIQTNIVTIILMKFLIIKETLASDIFFVIIYIIIPNLLAAISIIV